MGYNREDFVRIKAEYSEKYRRAREKADERRFELYGRIPEVKDIDSVLSGTGLEIMRIISSGKKDTEAEVHMIETFRKLSPEKREKFCDMLGLFVE